MARTPPAPPAGPHRVHRLRPGNRRILAAATAAVAALALAGCTAASGSAPASGAGSAPATDPVPASTPDPTPASSAGPAPGRNPASGPRSTKALVPSPSRAKSDLADLYPDGCQQSARRAEPLECDYGVEDGSETVVLVGSSHSAHWLPALQAISAERDMSIVTLTKSACAFSTETYSAAANAPSCEEWNEEALDRILEIDPDLVFTIATRGFGRQEKVEEGFLEQWEELGDAGIEVVAVRDNPRMGEGFLECLERNGPGDPACGVDREKVRPARSPVDLLEDKPRNVHFLDLTDSFCGPRTCLPAAGNVLIYRDPGHLTATFAETLGPPLERALEDSGL